MTGFAQRAQELLEAALSAPAASEMTVLIGNDGAIQLCADSDWPLDSLARERGARAAYRVSARRLSVRVEGRQGLQTCVLESGRPHQFLVAHQKEKAHPEGWAFKEKRFMPCGGDGPAG